MVMLPAFTDGPGAQPQRGGLVGVGGSPGAAIPGDTSIDWLKGVQWWPEDVGGYQLSSDCSTQVTNIGDVGVPNPVTAQPFMIRTNVQGPKSSHLDLAARARRRLDFVTSRAVARELWLGEQAQKSPFTQSTAYSWSNPSPSSGQYLSPYLTSGQGQTVTAPVGGFSPAQALAAVEDYLSELVTGGPMYLHVPLSIVSELGAILTRQGDLITTLAGSIIVPDRGYPGTGASGSSGQWVYGTGPVIAWIGDVDEDNDPASYLRVSDNHIEVWAERPACVLFDPQTIIAAAVTP